jgi:hypothetical protein
MVVSREYPFTIGFDGEFVYEKPGNILVSAEEISGKEGRIGTDGWSDIAEVRGGKYTKIPSLVAGIEESFRHFMPDKGRQYAWRVGAYPLGMPTGMHIHFGTRLNQNSRNILMDTLGLFLTLVEPKPDGQLRYDNFHRIRGYGKLDFFADKPYGTEYKMPWAFYTNPDFTNTVFTFASFVVFLSINGVMSKHSDVIDNAFHVRDYDMLRTRCLKLINKMADETAMMAIDPKFSYSQDEEQALETIKDLVENRKEIDCSIDIRDTWSRPNEDYGVIYDKSFKREHALTGVLKAIYVRQGSSDKFCVTIRKDGFGETRLQKVVPALAEMGLSVKVIENVQETYRSCPTLNVNPKLIQKCGLTIDSVINTTLNQLKGL